MEQKQVFTNFPIIGLEIVFKKWLKEVLTEVNIQQVCGSSEPEERLTRTQLATYLKCTLPTVDRYRSRGVFPYYQTGRTIYFKKSEVDNALAVGKKKGGVK